MSGGWPQVKVASALVVLLSRMAILVSLEWSFGHHLMGCGIIAALGHTLTTAIGDNDGVRAEVAVPQGTFERSAYLREFLRNSKLERMMELDMGRDGKGKEGA